MASMQTSMVSGKKQHTGGTSQLPPWPAILPCTHLVVCRLGIEVLAEVHDFQARLAQRRADRRRRLGLPRRDDQPYCGGHRLGL